MISSIPITRMRKQPINNKLHGIDTKPPNLYGIVRSIILYFVFISVVGGISKVFSFFFQYQAFPNILWISFVCVYIISSIKYNVYYTHHVYTYTLYTFIDLESHAVNNPGASSDYVTWIATYVLTMKIMLDLASYCEMQKSMKGGIEKRTKGKEDTRMINSYIVQFEHHFVRLIHVCVYLCRFIMYCPFYQVASREC